jgi:molybdate transport repressor ModE-like protein
VAATLTPPPASGANLGQLTRDAAGTFYVTRFGFGQHGAVVVVPGTGAAYDLNGLDPQRRRIGLARTPDAKLLVGWFRGGRAGGATGTISELSVQGGQGSERELITGLGKPAGLAVVGDQLFVTDQNTAQLLVFSLAAVRARPATAADARVVSAFLTSDQLDLMTAASDGTLYFGGSGGSLYQVNPRGEVRTLATGWGRVRGVALDEAPSPAVRRRCRCTDRRSVAHPHRADRLTRRAFIAASIAATRRVGAADGACHTITAMGERALSARAMGYAQADKRLEILHLVALHGSISQAARVAGVSYKAAWQAIHTLTNLAGEPLVDSSVGGAGGGGARLTTAGAAAAGRGRPDGRRAP